jgi:Tol biopolymer transport system component
MRTIVSISIFAILLTVMAFPQADRSVEFESNVDLGSPKTAGFTFYTPATGDYRLRGSGENMWSKRDEGHFAYREIAGDFILTSRVSFVGKGKHEHRKAGLMARVSLDEDAAHASAVVHGDGLTSLQYRSSKGVNTRESKLKVNGADILRLERKGNKFIVSAARFGEPFENIETTDIRIGGKVIAGIFICSHDPDFVEEAEFSNLRLTMPAPDGLVPYRDYIGSRLEILDVETGKRKVVHITQDSMQAPNWTPDGRYLIYNRNGRLYRFEIATGKVSEIDTGFATANNNDHVLSFDGKMLGISHHTEIANGDSIVYTLPSNGGDPKRITSKGPSYFHGWSPDGKWLLYTGGRGENYDIYKIPAEGGKEIRLTTAEGLDDGSEYTPDGKYIYFCSTRSGLMQIWRMKPDGSGQEQITNDDYNNWFPHISPDGKWIVMISYLKGDVAPEDHPFYKRVYLRLMPILGGTPKVIAYVYGGQGTINVPSWSPDSKKISFVSNTIIEE